MSFNLDNVPNKTELLTTYDKLKLKIKLKLCGKFEANTFPAKANIEGLTVEDRDALIVGLTAKGYICTLLKNDTKLKVSLE
jgi:hypothetical protein